MVLYNTSTMFQTQRQPSSVLNPKPAIGSPQGNVQPSYVVPQDMGYGGTPVLRPASEATYGERALQPTAQPTQLQQPMLNTQQQPGQTQPTVVQPTNSYNMSTATTDQRLSKLGINYPLNSKQALDQAFAQVASNPTATQMLRSYLTPQQWFMYNGSGIPGGLPAEINSVPSELAHLRGEDLRAGLMQYYNERQQNPSLANPWSLNASNADINFLEGRTPGKQFPNQPNAPVGMFDINTRTLTPLENQAPVPNAPSLPDMNTSLGRNTPTQLSIPTGPTVQPIGAGGTAVPAGEAPPLQRLFDFLKGDLERERDLALDTSRTNAARRGVYYGSPGMLEERDVNERFLRGLGQLEAGVLQNETQNELARLGLAIGLVPEDIQDQGGLDPAILQALGGLFASGGGSNAPATNPLSIANLIPNLTSLVQPLIPNTQTTTSTQPTLRPAPTKFPTKRIGLT